MIATGYQEPRTGRVALSLRDFLALDADIPGYWFSESNEEFGFDPWSVVEGIDPHVDGKKCDIWFASGRLITTTFDSGAVIFVSSKHAVAA